MLYTLVVPPLTSFIDHHISSEIAYESFKSSTIEYFQMRHGGDENVQVVFVESTPTSCASDECKHTLESIREYSNGFFMTVEGEFSPKITQLVARGLFNKDDLTAIVNPTNHRLSAKGGYTNQLIHGAVGEELEQSSLSIQTDVSGAGHKAPLVFTVLLKKDNLFRMQEGYRAVIQAVSPSLNPHRGAHCETSLEATREALKESYARIFDEFDRLVATLKAESREQHPPPALQVDERPPSKRVRASDEVPPFHTQSKTATVTVATDIASTAAPLVRSVNDVLKDKTHRDSIETSKTRPIPSTSGGGFGFNKKILFEYLRHPERHASSIHLQSTCCVAIRDAYPKARTHLLVLPMEGLLGDAIEVRQLRPEHLHNLKQIHAVARDIALNVQGDCKHPLLLGYHAAPSLHPLHIHLISSDLDSPALKTKKHWNSFALSEHFIDIDRVEDWLSRGLSVADQLPSEEALHDLVASTPLRCNQCQAPMSNMPSLKRHLLTHL